MDSDEIEEYDYQHVIEQLLEDNTTLNSKLHKVTAKLQKTEQSLEKAKKWIQELGTMKNDISELRKSAELGSSSSTQQELIGSLRVENDALKSRI